MTAPPSTAQPITAEERARQTYRKMVGCGTPCTKCQASEGTECKEEIAIIETAIRDAELARDAQAVVARVVAVNEKLEELKQACLRQSAEARQYAEAANGSTATAWNREASTWQDAADLAVAHKLPPVEQLAKGDIDV